MVCPIQDNDEPGKAFSQRMSADLQGITSSVKVLDLAKIWPQLPHKGDSTDLIQHMGKNGAIKRHKDKKIVIYNSVHGQGEMGYTVVGYKPIHPGKLWAYVRQLSGQERLAALSIQIEKALLFVINWRKYLSTSAAKKNLYLEYNVCWYNITRIDTFGGYKEDLQLYGKPGYHPKESELLRYA